MDDILLETEVPMVSLQASTLAVISYSFAKLFLFFSLLSIFPFFSSSHIFDSNKDHSKSIRTKKTEGCNILCKAYVGHEIRFFSLILE